MVGRLKAQLGFLCCRLGYKLPVPHVQTKGLALVGLQLAYRGLILVPKSAFLRGKKCLFQLTQSLERS